MSEDMYDARDAESRPLRRPRWWEEYRCGCVSDVVDRKRDLLGYCPQHGEGRRHAHRDYTPRDPYRREQR